MKWKLRPPLVWTGLWLLLVAVALWSRPMLPVDETRYLAVAWEMWLRGDFLVPHLNGETYSHKPPLLFWLFHAGWAVFGVNDWWPRLVAPLFGLAALFLTATLARRLWPEMPALADAAPLILLTFGFWTLFTTLTMFDMLLTCFTLLGLIGVIDAWKRKRWRGWLLLGVAIGLGILAKGPAILLHTLPVVLLAPYWTRMQSTETAAEDAVPMGGWGRWYGGAVLAIALGAFLALAWAVPAGLAGGEAYRDAIFWGQTAGRMVDSFAHEQPWWWFLVFLPVLLLPSIVWPALRRDVRLHTGFVRGHGFRFCVAWFVPVFVCFSLISGKQFHYLLPIMPALAMVFGRMLLVAEQGRRRDHAVPALFVSAVATACFIATSGIFDLLPEEWQARPDAGWMFALALLGLIAAASGVRRRTKRLIVLAGLTVATVIAVHMTLRPILRDAFDLKPLALKLAAWEEAGHPIAHYGKYHGQFHFLGRLARPFVTIGDQSAADWMARNPNGKIVTVQRKVPDGARPEVVQRFRSRLITVWDVGEVAGDLDLVRRGNE